MSKRKTATVDASKAAAAAVVAEEEVRVAAPARRRCSLERIVAECERRSERPLVSADILAQLLKIQAKYLDEHPCLCTSRFRHILHQLDHDRHKKLADLCSELQKLSMQSVESKVATATAFKEIVPTVFECDVRCCDEVGEVDRRLEAVLARLVSDYRAIFVIEEEVEGGARSQSLQHQTLDHDLHRKRHEEDDDCPEEIKLMKVAWEDLTLECSASLSQTDAGVTTAEASADEDEDADGVEYDHDALLPDGGGIGDDPIRSPYPARLEYLATDSSSNSSSAPECTNLITKYNAIFRAASTNRSNDDGKLQGDERSDQQKWSPRLCSESKLCGVRRTNNHSSSDRNKRGDAKPECPSDPDHGGVHARKRKERTISESDKHETKCCRPSTINNSDSSAISWSDDDSACDFTDRFEKCGRGRERLEESAADDAEEKASHEDAAASTADEGEDGDEEKTATAKKREKDKQTQTSHHAKVETYAANDAPTAQNNNDTSTATAVPRKDRSDFLKENQDDHDDQPAAAEAAATEERKKKKTASKQSGAAKRPLNHSLSAPVFPGYEASAAAVEAAAASVPSLAASWMIDHQPVSWSPGMMRTHAAGPLDPPSSGSKTTYGMLHSYLDPNHSRRFGQRRGSDPEQLRRARLKQLRRQLSNVRKKMEEVQLDFETNLGYRPSQIDRKSDKSYRRLLHEQMQLKKQIKSYRELTDEELLEMEASPSFDDSIFESDESGEAVVFCEDSNESTASAASAASTSGSSPNATSQLPPAGNNNSCDSRDLESMRNTLIDIEQRLRAQRKMSQRPTDVDEMTSDQLMEEKLELQSCLMHFEHLFGNHAAAAAAASASAHSDCGSPAEAAAAAEEAEKALMKNLYDRYRKVKRLVRRSSAKSEQQLELETIPEDEAIPLTLASPQYRINIELTKIDSKQEAASPTAAESFVGSTGDIVREDDDSVDPSCGDDEDDDVASNGNESAVAADSEESLHSLSRYELLEILRRTREEKRFYRKTAKEKEAAAVSSTSAASKMKAAGDEVGKYHQLYKRSKAKIKLIDALLSKRVDHFY